MSKLESLPFASVLPEDATALELVKFSAIGFFVVFLSLTLVALLCSIVGYLLRKVASQTLPSRSSAAAEDELSEEVVAVIAAAVAEVISMPHRIVHIRGLTPEDLGWSLEGRMQHHASHTRPRQ